MVADMTTTSPEPLPPAITVTVACPICAATLTVQPTIDPDTGLYGFPADTTIADHEAASHPAPPDSAPTTIGATTP